MGGGLAYGALGMSHHATEDLAMMRVLPKMVVVAPGDPVEVEHATRAIAAHPGPCYLRLGRTGEKTLHDANIQFELGKAITFCDGDDLSLISTGGLLETALQVADGLAREGVRTRVLSMHTVAPLDVEAVVAAARETGAIATLEEHSVVGGLGSAVAEVLAESGEPVHFKRLGLPPFFSDHVGSQEYLRDKFGISPPAIREALEPILQQNRGV